MLHIFCHFNSVSKCCFPSNAAFSHSMDENSTLKLIDKMLHFQVSLQNFHTVSFCMMLLIFFLSLLFQVLFFNLTLHFLILCMETLFVYIYNQFIAHLTYWMWICFYFIIVSRILKK